jgi:LasA protease
LLPNSEFINSPAYVNFDIASFVAEQGGYLAEYSEQVNGIMLSGPEIVRLTAHHYSVGPRLLLTILEMRSGWVTNPSPSAQSITYPMGHVAGGWELLSRQLAWAADELNRGYYNWRNRGATVITWGDGTATRYAPTLNAATAGLQYFFSLQGSKSRWQTAIGDGPDSMIATYRRFFGDPSQYAIEPLIAANTAMPELALPWSDGELWYYTGGPHGGWSDGSAWAALDFVPDEGYLGCQPAASWATAAAPGLVIYSQNGEVLVDLDEDGREETGWVLFYLHVGSEGRVPVGSEVRAGDPIGHPSCEGGAAESSHLHFARRYNGEWIAADGPLPMILTGWQAHSDGAEYDGTLTRGNDERTACECRTPEYNGLVGGQ